jgi:hypothetical protein
VGRDPSPEIPSHDIRIVGGAKDVKLLDYPDDKTSYIIYYF